jgi:glycine/D-amino acid oxidase-like deaminating enzyme
MCYEAMPSEESISNEGWENRTAGKTTSSWYADPVPLQFQKLGQDISVEVVVIGGGIAGITTAYLLCKTGRKVALIEDGDLCSGETGRTTAHITNALDDRYYNIEKIQGKKGAMLAAESHTAAIEMIESIVTAEGIDCDFERLDGYLFRDPTGTQKSLENELDATHRAGIRETDLLPRAPLDFDTGTCIRFPHQAQFQPLRYLAGLARAIVRRGGSVYTRTHAHKVNATGVRTSDGHRVSAKKIIIATNAPIVDKLSKIYDRQTACRTYVLGHRESAVKKRCYAVPLC